MPRKPSPTFAIGDRVTYKESMPKLSTGGHGEVVWYKNDEHDPKAPRIRWASGWGWTVYANQLRLLTPEECLNLPTVNKFPCDFYEKPTPLACCQPSTAP